jgi:hypothetical protein
MKRARIGLRIATLALLVAAAVPGLARAQEPGPLGFVLAGSSAGIALLYDQPSAPIPASPTAEFSIGRSVARLSAGPSGYALASLAWPGEVAANAPPFVSGEIKRSGGGDQFPDFPGYPVRAESFFPQGPADQTTEPAAGLSMRSHADRSRSEAGSRVGASEIPGLLSVGSVRSAGRSSLDGARAIAEAWAGLSDVDVLDGLVSLGSISSSGKASSDGVRAKVEGSIRVAGLEIAGQRAAVDENGVHAFGQDSGPSSATVNQVMQQALAQAGVTILLAGPVDAVKGASGSRSVGGLLIRVDATALRAAVKQMPDQIREQVQRNIDLDQSLTIVLGGLTVSAGATGAGAAVPVPEGPVSGFEAPSGAGSSVAGAASLMAPNYAGRSADQVAMRPALGSSPRGLAPLPSGFAGVPYGLGMLVVVCGLLVAAAAGRLVDLALGARQSLQGCDQA